MGNMNFSRKEITVFLPVFSLSMDTMCHRCQSIASVREITCHPQHFILVPTHCFDAYNECTGTDRAGSDEISSMLSLEG